ncbi:MAG: hypothetical protein QHD01_04895 [Bradyrhizobium sp.]|uniref:hypothetical protein n=1 Tax=Bradyrhizobium sp. TaxID=376 RepID=UPI0029BBD8AE|nr:hypothetical protein [Bradyrhizobium sp.]MDX3965919.1 hypothetical protein [Bradyrhizobium sp.]
MPQTVSAEGARQQPRTDEQESKAENVDRVRLSRPKLIPGIGPDNQRDADCFGAIEQAEPHRDRYQTRRAEDNSSECQRYHHEDRGACPIRERIVAIEDRMAGTIQKEIEVDEIVRTRLEHQPVVHEEAVVHEHRRMCSQQHAEEDR